MTIVLFVVSDSADTPGRVVCRETDQRLSAPGVGAPSGGRRDLVTVHAASQRTRYVVVARYVTMAI